MNKPGIILLNSVKRISENSVSSGFNELRKVMIDIFKAQGISDINSVVVQLNSPTLSQYDVEVPPSSMVFFEETTLLEESGLEKDSYICLISGKDYVTIFTSKSTAMNNFIELKYYKKYFNIMEKDFSLSFIPYLLFCLEVFQNISQKKIIEISSYLKKLKQISLEQEKNWKTAAFYFCELLVYYSFELEEDDLDYTRPALISIINEEGEWFILLTLVDSYVDNPTLECKEKRKRSVNGFLESENQSKMSGKLEEKKEISFFKEIIDDFIEVSLSLLSSFKVKSNK